MLPGPRLGGASGKLLKTHILRICGIQSSNLLFNTTSTCYRLGGESLEVLFGWLGFGLFLLRLGLTMSLKLSLTSIPLASAS